MRHLFGIVLGLVLSFGLTAQTPQDFEEMKRQNQALKEQIEEKESEWMKENPHHDFKEKIEATEQGANDQFIDLFGQLPSSSKYALEKDDGPLSRLYKCIARTVLQSQEAPAFKSQAVMLCNDQAKNKEACLRRVQKQSEQVDYKNMFSNVHDCINRDVSNEG